MMIDNAVKVLGLIGISVRGMCLLLQDMCVFLNAFVVVNGD